LWIIVGVKRDKPSAFRTDYKRSGDATLDGDGPSIVPSVPFSTGSAVSTLTFIPVDCQTVDR